MLADASFIVSSPENEQYPNQHQPKVLNLRRQRSRYLDPTSKRITLNVNGTRYQTYEETLSTFPDTLLGSPTKRNHFYNERTEEYNLPRSNGSFDSILFYYQSRGILARPSTISVKDFDEELQFYQITNPDPLAVLLRDDDVNELATPVVGETFKERMWVILEFPHSCRLGQIIALISIIVIVFSIVIFNIETLATLRKKQDSDLWFAFETTCVIWFTGEYLCRLYSAPQRRVFVMSAMGIVDLLAILPFFVTLFFKNELEDVRSFLVMRALRLFRVLRIFKLSRYSVGFKILLNTIVDSVEQMRPILFCTIIAVVVFGSVEFIVEGPEGDFMSIPHSMWWAVQTMSSVGYGDIVPETVLGRFVSALCAISGILLFCLPTPILVANFLKHYTHAFLNPQTQDKLGETQKKLVDNMQRIYLSSNR
ncbi:potassium voltage-gated channel subfamily A member 2-like [Dendronephthya gigantea]|uniref:potassium voltage-gated channel subfamily A member 2-like n=1 Tax=Dendronephthya gigantea TaxID=151771 RepID=UPI0010697EF4|nr:potassium voltage-gated channel subfamily A member 2-like [Dendronephthya gigantea]XP_028402219.1 potassium voltage-gated channel subfamily A member 2-like [Dendronephthya gigantea]